MKRERRSKQQEDKLRTEVAALVSKGLKAPEIAWRVCISKGYAHRLVKAVKAK